MQQVNNLSIYDLYVQKVLSSSAFEQDLVFSCPSYVYHSHTADSTVQFAIICLADGRNRGTTLG